MKNVLICLIIYTTCLLFGQYDKDNRVVTLSKYFFKPINTVENGNREERSKVILENRKKLDFKDKHLISSSMLYHYWSGQSNEVLEINEWNSIADADESTRTTADRRKKAWPNDEKRKEISREIDRTGKKMDFLIQVNTGEEAQKSGVFPSNFDGFFKYCSEDLNLPVKGLMCIPPVNDEPAKHFALLAEMSRRYKLSCLSMGMSADFETAIRMGATHVRIGTAIFGEREKVD